MPIATARYDVPLGDGKSRVFVHYEVGAKAG